MKVLVFADFRSPHARGWADGLEMCGIEVRRVSSLSEPADAAGGGIRGGAGRQMVRRLSRDAGHRVRTAEALARQPRRRRVLAAVSRDFQPDIVHALRLPYEGVSALSAVGDSVPVVVSTWGQDFVAQAAADPVLRAWIRRVIPAAAGLIADVESDVDRARHYGLGNVPTLVAAANFGLEVGTPSRIDLESPTVTYTRGLTTHVDYNAFIAAIPLVIERARLPWKFVGIGLEGVPGTRTLLEDVAFGERVQFTGNVDLATFNSLIRASAATCSPAISDGMPISVLTSLSEGRATLVGALPHYAEIAAGTPLLRIMSGTDAQAISAAILELDEIWSTSASPPLAPYVPSAYDRRRNRDVVPEYYERVIRGRRGS